MTDRIADPWGRPTPFARGAEWPVRVDTYLLPGIRADEVDAWVPTASILHSNGDALDVAVKDGAMVGVRGRADSRVNRGRLGPKDLFGWQANASPDRLRRPLVRRDGELVETDWDAAMEAMVRRSRELLASQGPSALAIYTSGQLFLEEYYTLAVIGRAGLGTNHIDGNTRLCTATAAEALKETFGCDGQPGSYTDVDHCDVLFLVGHNVAETQPTLWRRMADRLDGPDPPRLIVVDPRPTVPARCADVHLAVRDGTNLALLNAILGELIAADRVDRAFVAARTVGYAELAARVRDCTAERAAETCGVDARRIRDAVRILGTHDRILSTCLQGVYQAHQATAAAVQVNNINLLRGALGRPGAGILQMNGQPSAENTRECGANGDLPGFRNWSNAEHVRQLAELWNVDVSAIPHHAPPTHAMQIFRYAEEGSVGWLWISGTNPAVSLPELRRIRSILAREELFVVVQDLFLTETAELADVVLPAATWAEKEGTFTNADRTVHHSDKAVDPPGEARSDLDIFLDYARRMDFRDKDGGPLITWHDPESAFRAWQACTAGRPCDYTGMSYDKLRAGGETQWPCNERWPGGRERLYTDGDFAAHPDDCESYGKDLVTGTALEENEYWALNPDGRAMLKAAEEMAPPEAPDDAHPLGLTTGRTVYHFHTRTKTGRAPQLQAAAPDVWAELSASDAAQLGIGEGDVVDVVAPRGRVRARARITAIRPGLVFVPFHYGSWDLPADAAARHDRAANELTITGWDAASEQPLFKTAACRVERVAGADGNPAAAPTTAASRPLAALDATTGGPDAEADEEVVS
jgi:anaerobic selenocysteine-containing dehydrogenase